MVCWLNRDGPEKHAAPVEPERRSRSRKFQRVGAFRDRKRLKRIQISSWCAGRDFTGWSHDSDWAPSHVVDTLADNNRLNVWQIKYLLPPSFFRASSVLQRWLPVTNTQDFTHQVCFSVQIIHTRIGLGATILTQNVVFIFQTFPPQTNPSSNHSCCAEWTSRLPSNNNKTDGWQAPSVVWQMRHKLSRRQQAATHLQSAGPLNVLSCRAKPRIVPPSWLFHEMRLSVSPSPVRTVAFNEFLCVSVANLCHETFQKKRFTTATFCKRCDLYCSLPECHRLFL